MNVQDFGGIARLQTIWNICVRVSLLRVQGHPQSHGQVAQGVTGIIKIPVLAPNNSSRSLLQGVGSIPAWEGRIIEIGS